VEPATTRRKEELEEGRREESPHREAEGPAGKNEKE
jgi:hypothetical protein